METQYPLYSLVIVTYNQEKFIRQTLQGAFSQTYPNLEIIVSDDCSTDKNWDIIQEEIAKYSGPHKIILNRNPVNLGIAGGAGKAMELAHGEVIVWNDGDDVSQPQRVQKIYDVFSKDVKHEITMVWSRHEGIDGDGNIRPYKHFNRDYKRRTTCLEKVGTRLWFPLGTASAWRREINIPFPKITPLNWGWDNAVAFRAILLGRIECISEILVHYRCHAGSTTNANTEELSLQQQYKRNSVGDYGFLQYYAVNMQDLTTIQLKTKSPERLAALHRGANILSALIQRQLVSYEINSTFPHISFRTVLRALRYPGFHRHLIKAILVKLKLLS